MLIYIFSYKNCVTDETTSNDPVDVYGGILADHMGLGKSLTALALITSTLGFGQSFENSGAEGFPVKTTLLSTYTLLLPTYHISLIVIPVQLHQPQVIIPSGLPASICSIIPNFLTSFKQLGGRNQEV